MRSIFRTPFQQFTHRSNKKFFPLIKTSFTLWFTKLRVIQFIQQIQYGLVTNILLVNYCIFKKKVYSLSWGAMILDYFRCEATENYTVFSIGLALSFWRRYRGPFIFKNFCFFLNWTWTWGPEGFGTFFSDFFGHFFEFEFFQVSWKIGNGLKKSTQ